MAAQGSRAQEVPASPDPWPRPVKLADASLLIYQPQLESWQGNRATFRAAVGASVPGGGEPAYGVVWATARTEVDPIRRAVTLQDVQISRGDFPTLPDEGAAYLAGLRQALPIDAAHHVAGPDGGVARGLGRGQRRAGGGGQPAARDHRQLPARGPDPDRRRPGPPAGLGHELRAGDQHAGGDPARRERRPVLPPRLRRLARGRHARRRLAAGGATDAGARRRRRAGGKACRGRPAERARRAADDLRPPHPGRAGRVRRPARLPAGRHHGPALGRQHQVRRAVRQRRQPVLRPGRGPLVPLDPGQRAVELRLRQGPAGLLPRDPDRLPGRGRAADRGRHAAGQGGGDRGLDPPHRHRAAEGRARVHPGDRRLAAAAPDRGHRAALRRQLADADHRDRTRAVLRAAVRDLVRRLVARRPVDGGDLGPRRGLRHPAGLAAALRHLRRRLRRHGGGRPCRLHAGLPGQRGGAGRGGGLRHRLRLPALDRHRMVPAARDLRGGGRAGLQPGGGVGLRHGARPDHGGAGRLLGQQQPRRLLRALLPRLPVLRLDLGPRLRPVRRHLRVGHREVVLELERQCRPQLLRQLHRLPDGRDRQRLGQPELRRADRRDHGPGQPQLRHARGHHRRRAAQRELRPAGRQDHDQRVRLGHQPLRRHRGRAAQHQLRRADRPVELRRVAFGHRRRRQHGNAADHGRGRRRPIAGEPRDHDLQRAHRPDQQLRPRRGRRPALRRQRRQRLPAAAATGGSSTARTAGRPRRATRAGPTASSRRAPTAPTGSPASRVAVGIASAVGPGAAIAGAMAAVSAGSAAGASGAAGSGDGGDELGRQSSSRPATAIRSVSALQPRRRERGEASGRNAARGSPGRAG